MWKGECYLKTTFSDHYVHCTTVVQAGIKGMLICSFLCRCIKILGKGKGRILAVALLT